MPSGALALMLVLLAVGVWAWWVGRRRQTGRLWPWATGVRHPTRGSGAATVVTATRLDAHTRLVIVRWAGSELLLAASTHAPPVVLDRRPLPVPASPETD